MSDQMEDYMVDRCDCPGCSGDCCPCGCCG